MTLEDINEIQNKLKLLCDEIKKIWESQKVILIDVYPAKNFCNRDGKIEENRYYDAMYQKSFSYPVIYKIAVEFIKEYLSGCNIVKIPDKQYVMVDANHAWGVYPFHYSDMVYNFYYNEICKIAIPDYLCKGEVIKKKIKQEYYRAKGIIENNKKRVLSDEILDCMVESSFIKYLECLKKIRNCIVIFSIKDTAGTYFNNSIQKKMRELGLVADLIKIWNVGYIAIIKDGASILERRSEKGGTEECHIEIDNHLISVKSEPFKNGDCASVCIDKQEYAMNQRGINIVIFDLLRAAVVDSVAFDTHSKEYTCMRDNKWISQEDAIRLDIRKLLKKMDKTYKMLES